MKEIWSVIIGFPMYKISTFGRVKSLYTNKILKPVNKNGYMFVTLVEGNKKYNRAIHRLVAKAFIANPNRYPMINHKDENKQNNSVENLEWCDIPYNLSYGTARERSSEKHSKKVYQYTLDGKLVKVYDKIKNVIEDGFDESCVSLCCNGKNKKHKGFKWYFNPL
jgi:hypothetical protein